MDIAVVRLGGKQHTIKNGETLKVDRVAADVKPEVLLWQEGKTIEIGTPVLKDRSIKIEILENKLDKKVNVSRFKAKSRYRKHKGFRQPISAVRVTGLDKSDKSE